MTDPRDVRVVIVEDEALVGEMVRGMLETAGYQVLARCANGPQALEAVPALQPDVLVIDIGLPGMDGLELTRRLMAAGPRPVVVLTAYETPGLVAQASAAGVGAYLTKPPSARTLDHAIQITLARFTDLQTLQRLNTELRAENVERQRAEAEVRQLNADLEQRVQARTFELRQANEALTRALRVKDEFLSTISHELRSPLAGVLNLAQALQMGVYGPLNDRQRRPVALLQASGERLLGLVSDVLDYTALEAGAPLHLAVTAVADLCQTSLDAVRAHAHAKQISLAYRPDPAVTTAWADPQRLQQMLIKLLENAIKFTPEGGAAGLEVTVQKDASAQPAVCFSVWDTGIGISPADQAQLFQPFVQLDSRLARNYEGAGLGLALVRRLAELHGGRVTLESQGIPGLGSRFTVLLPQPANRLTPTA